MVSYLVGGLEHFLFSHILGMSSSQLTFIFFRGIGLKPPTRYGFPKNMIYKWSLSHIELLVYKRVTGKSGNEIRHGFAWKKGYKKTSKNPTCYSNSLLGKMMINSMDFKIFFGANRRIGCRAIFWIYHKCPDFLGYQIDGFPRCFQRSITQHDLGLP